MLLAAGVVTKPPLVREVYDLPDLRSGVFELPWHEMQLLVKIGCISAENDHVVFGSTVALIICTFSHDDSRTNSARINPAEIILLILIISLFILVIVN
jgi:hypothetical protein